MLKLLSFLLVPSIVFSAPQSQNPTDKTKTQDEPMLYETVSEWTDKSHEKADTYEQKDDKSLKNSGIRTLEEPIEREFFREKKPFAKVLVKIRSNMEKEQSEKQVESVSGEEYAFDSIENVIASLNDKFSYMYELKNQLDEYEKQTAKLWSEYYAIKDVYDRALQRYSEKWAEDNGINFVPKSAWRR